MGGDNRWHIYRDGGRIALYPNNLWMKEQRMPTILENLSKSDYEVERAIAEALRAYQDSRAKQGLPCRLGYEPRDIVKMGAVEVIRRRIRNNSKGFEGVPI
jgi:hypothetical protein